jgi:hypothetical protein
MPLPKIASSAPQLSRNESSPLTLPRGRLSRLAAIAHPAISPYEAVMNALPVDRALAIHSTIANRSEHAGARALLSRHLMKVFLEGERDPHRLTVHGLTYLRYLDRERDS